MNTKILQKVEKAYYKHDFSSFNVGDTIKVHNIIREKSFDAKSKEEKEKTRIQIFEGIVIAKKGSGTRATFTVRKIAANRIGVEKIFPIHSPNIEKIELVRKGSVRRAKLYYLRDRIGKRALKVKEKV